MTVENIALKEYVFPCCDRHSVVVHVLRDVYGHTVRACIYRINYNIHARLLVNIIRALRDCNWIIILFFLLIFFFYLYDVMQYTRAIHLVVAAFSGFTQYLRAHALVYCVFTIIIARTTTTTTTTFLDRAKRASLGFPSRKSTTI